MSSLLRQPSQSESVRWKITCECFTVNFFLLAQLRDHCERYEEVQYLDLLRLVVYLFQFEPVEEQIDQSLLLEPESFEDSLEGLSLDSSVSELTILPKLITNKLDIIKSEQPLQILCLNLKFFLGLRFLFGHINQIERISVINMDYSRNHPFILRFFLQTNLFAHVRDALGFLSQNQHFAVTATPKLPEGQDALTLIQAFKIHMEGREDQWSLLWACFMLLKWDFLQVTILLCLQIGLRIMTSIFLYNSLTELQQQDKQQAILYGILTIVCLILSKICQQNGMSKIQMAMNKLRMALVGTLTQHLLKLSPNTILSKQLDKTINLISTDINNIQFKLIFLSYLFTLPILVGGVCAVLIERCGVGAIIGPIFCVAVLPFSTLVGKQAAQIRTELKATIDQRMKASKEMIEVIRLVKMYGWQNNFKDKILTLRSQQIVQLMKLGLCLAYDRAISNIIPVVGSFLIFIYLQFGSKNLSFPIIFSTIDIMTFFKFNFFLVTNGVNFLFEAKVIMSRFLSVFSIVPGRFSKSESGQVDSQQNLAFKEVYQEKQELISSGIAFTNYTAFWNNINPSLKNVNLKLQPGLTYALIGRVGSGKSTFFQAILYDIPKFLGSLSVNMTVSYYSQEPVIIGASLKDNILFGREYKEQRYQRIIRACCLWNEISNMPKKDDTEIGQKGINLSVGQQARVALARAIYQQADLYLLDDPFSSVDAKVGSHIFEQVIKKQLKGKCVVLSTHLLSMARRMDRLLLIQQGQIAIALPQEKDIQFLQENINQKNTQTQTQLKVQAQDDIIIQEQAQNVAVGIDTFTKYIFIPSARLLFVGSVFMIAIVLAIDITIFRLYGTYPNLGNPGYLQKHQFYGVVGGLIFTSMLMNYLKFLFINWAFCARNQHIHAKIITSLIRAPVSFYDKSPIGRILNRLSADLDTLDTSIGFNIAQVFEGLLAILVLIVNIFTITPYFIIPCVIFLFINSFLFYKVRPLVVALKGLQLIEKSKVFDFINSTKNGMTYIQLFRQEQTFHKKIRQYCQNTSRANNFYWMSSRFLTFYNSLLANIIWSIGFIVGMITRNSQYGVFGSSVIFLTQFNQSMLWTVRQAMNIEALMISVQRILNYTELQQQPPQIIDKDQEWNDVQNGDSIQFEKVTMRYREGLRPALELLDLKIKAGSKLAVVGRTGAGKSSIIQCIFRMFEIQSGALKVHGRSINSVGLKALRNKIAIIPQIPFVFNDTVRKNLDPFNQHSEQSIWKAVFQSGLGPCVQALPQRLQTWIGSNKDVFSLGQKQLLCLARALLKKAKIIILDQATSSVDLQSEEFVQKVIFSKFKDCTVLAIAHRLDTVACFDRVAIMEHGKLVQQGGLLELLLQNGELGRSRFAEMVRASGQSNIRSIMLKAQGLKQ